MKEQKIITPEKFRDKMFELSKDDDVELRHGAMDGLMCDVLESLGYGEGVAIFNNTRMWYA